MIVPATLRLVQGGPVESPEGERYLTAMAGGQLRTSKPAGHDRRRTGCLPRCRRGRDAARLRRVAQPCLTRTARDGRPAGPALCPPEGSDAGAGARRSCPAGCVSGRRPAGASAGIDGHISYVLVGELGGEASHSTCHSAGRAMSRKRAMKGQSGRELTGGSKTGGFGWWQRCGAAVTRRGSRPSRAARSSSASRLVPALVRRARGRAALQEGLDLAVADGDEVPVVRAHRDER